MKRYIIEKEILVDLDIRVILLSLTANVSNINRNIIPPSQIQALGRYRLRRDSEKRLLARSFLYELLLEEYGITDFRLNFNKFQKPSLAANPEINFSFSYAYDLVLVALCKSRQMGADIEYLSDSVTIRDIAPQIMCTEELERFNRYDDALQQKIFWFEVFSAKESIVKAFGTGLHYEIKEINVLAPGQLHYNSSSFVYKNLGLYDDQYTMAVCYEAATDNSTQ